MIGTKTEIVELRIYPVKSCRGIRVNEANLTLQGEVLETPKILTLPSNDQTHPVLIEKGMRFPPH